jgi:hypothetical protein
MRRRLELAPALRLMLGAPIAGVRRRERQNAARPQQGGQPLNLFTRVGDVLDIFPQRNTVERAGGGAKIG